jgi:excinuclease ABC subunit B
LRSERSLIQTIGRAARNAEGKAILYADKITDSMKKAIDETVRRRKVQEEYNQENGITPTTIVKSIDATLVTAYEADYFKVPLELDKFEEYSPKQLKETISQIEADMRFAAREMKFERAAELRDRLKYLKERQLEYS